MWRDYDPAIGRFFKVDRFAEKYYDKTPYNYAANNPVYFIDVMGDSVYVDQKYRKEINNILEQSFGANASKFNYNSNGALTYTGKTKDFSKDEKKAFDVLNKLLTSNVSYSFVIEENVSITKPDGTTQNINTGQNGAMGDAAIYPSATKDGKGILALNPNSSSILVPVLDVKYDSGNQLPVNFGDTLLNNGRGPNRTYSMYENFWHGIGHLDGGSKNGGRAMEVENLGGTIRKTITTDSSGAKKYTPSPIPTKHYNANHPKK